MEPGITASMKGNFNSSLSLFFNRNGLFHKINPEILLMILRERLTASRLFKTINQPIKAPNSTEYMTTCSVNNIPVHAPIPAKSLTSPAPTAPIKCMIRRTVNPTAAPPKAHSSPCQLLITPCASRPVSKPDKVIQFGILIDFKSVISAAAKNGRHPQNVHSAIYYTPFSTLSLHYCEHNLNRSTIIQLYNKRPRARCGIYTNFPFPLDISIFIRLFPA